MVGAQTYLPGFVDTVALLTLVGAVADIANKWCINYCTLASLLFCDSAC